jgi:hypothetical protein
MDVSHGFPLLRPRPRRLSPEGDGTGGPPGETTPPAGTTPPVEVTPPATTPPPVSPTTFSQDEVNRLIGKARDEGKKQAQDEAKRKAAEEEAKAKGEWEQLATTRETEIAALKAQLADRDRALLVAKVAAAHRLPPEIADLLKGETEAAIDAHAKTLAKVVAPLAAPDTEAGSGTRERPGPGDRPQPKRVDGPVFAFDGTPKVAWPRRS